MPANCTDYLQPLGLTVNKVAQSYLKQQFSEWYANEFLNQILSSSNDNTTPEPVDLSTVCMKNVGVGWLIQLYEYLQHDPHHVVNGFLVAGISQSIDAGKPVFAPYNNDEGSDSDSGHKSESED